MTKTQWKPTNQTGRYDKKRIATLRPIHQAVERLGLPLIQKRKLFGILNAVEMQIEDGGDHPEVNAHLLEALRLAVVHQAGEQKAATVLKVIDNFAQTEEKRWNQIRAGTLPPIELDPEEKLDELMQEGYALISNHQTAAGCDQWLAAWELVKKLATPSMRTVKAFDKAYPGRLQSLFNWSQDLEMELNNAGSSDPLYFEHRVRYAREYLAQFPDDTADRHVAFRRAEGEALWNLGRTAEAEAVYQQLVEAFPDQAEGYIGWSDQYYMWRDAPGDYERAEEILQQALTRPKLDDRPFVEERLAKLYKQKNESSQTATPTPAASNQKAGKPKKPKPKRIGGRKKRR